MRFAAVPLSDCQSDNASAAYTAGARSCMSHFASIYSAVLWDVMLVASIFIGSVGIFLHFIPNISVAFLLVWWVLVLGLFSFIMPKA